MAAELKQIERGYSAHAVEILSELLELAKQGELIELVAFYKLSDRSWRHRMSGCDDVFRLIGVLELIKERQIRRTYE